MKFTERIGRWELSEVALSQAIFAAMQVYIPWLAASRAPMTELAILALAQSIVWPLAMVAQLQLRTLYVVQGQQSLLPLFIQLRLGGCVFLFASAAIGAGLLRDGAQLVNLALALALIKCAEIVADILHGELQRAMELRRAARSQTVRCTIFIGVYTLGMVYSGHLVLSLAAAGLAMGAWVLAVDIGPGRFWRNLLTHGSSLDHLGPTLKAGVLLSTALALTSLSVMIGRWAALRADDTGVLAATALAGTMASIVAVVLSATQQYSLQGAREQLQRGGVGALRAWSGVVSRRLHVCFGALALAWVVAAVVVHASGWPVPGQHLGLHLQQTVIVLAGCFLAGGWLSVLCFPDTMELYLTQRHAGILLVALVQVIAAAAASLLLYPLLGWSAIGIAELARGVTFIAATKFSTRRRYAPKRLSPSEQP